MLLFFKIGKMKSVFSVVILEGMVWVKLNDGLVVMQESHPTLHLV